MDLFLTKQEFDKAIEVLGKPKRVGLYYSGLKILTMWEFNDITVGLLQCPHKPEPRSVKYEFNNVKPWELTKPNHIKHAAIKRG